MKLIQYRFLPNASASARLVGSALQSLFEGASDLDVRAVYVEPRQLNKVICRNIKVEEIGVLAGRSFSQSYAKAINYSDYLSIRSNITCRFVVFEDDGLLRICHRLEDDILDFGRLVREVKDISEILIKSDLFD